MTNEIALIEKQTADVVQTANNMVVDCQEKYIQCDKFLAIVKGLRKEVDLAFDDNIHDAYQLHKNLVASKKIHSDPLDKAESIVKNKSLSWIKEQQRKQAEEQAKIAAEARRKEEEIRRVKEEQERAWREKEAAARAESQRLANIAAQEQDAKARAEAQAAAERARLEAEKAQVKANERKAEAEQVHVPVAMAAPQFDQAQGQSIKTVWKCEVTDIRLLCKTILDGQLPSMMILPNQVNLNNLAKAIRDTQQYPGLRFYSEDSLVKRIG